MPRRAKQTADYFPHDAGGASKTIYMLESRYGNDGYAFWYRLMELLSRSEGHLYRAAGDSDWEYFLAVMKVEETVAAAILVKLAQTGAIDKALWEEERIIWCQALVDNLAPLYAKRTIDAPEKPLPGAFPCRETAGNPQRKGEQRKAKEREEKAKKKGREQSTTAKSGPPAQRADAAPSPAEAAVDPGLGREAGPGAAGGGDGSFSSSEDGGQDEPSSLQQRFLAFWRAYPVKRNVWDAQKVWYDLSPSEALCERMLAAIAVAQGSSRWQKENGRYIPYPANWLRAKGWEQDPGPAGKSADNFREYARSHCARPELYEV